MKGTTKLVIGLAVVVLGAILFLVPVEAIPVESTCPLGVNLCSVSAIPPSASVTYYYFGVGAVYVPNYSGGHSYCLMYGNPGTMCGVWMKRTMMG